MGCCTPKVVPVDLSHLIPPDLRSLTEEELKVVTDETYSRVVKGEKRIKTLQDIILSTKQGE